MLGDLASMKIAELNKNLRTFYLTEKIQIM
jgi:hypothetical protein